MEIEYEYLMLYYEKPQLSSLYNFNSTAIIMVCMPLCVYYYCDSYSSYTLNSI